MRRQNRPVEIRSAPDAIPDIRIRLGMARQRILLPLVPCHGAVFHSQSPDQRSVDRSPDAAILERPDRTAKSRRPLALNHCADGRRLADQFIHRLDQGRGLLSRRRTANTRPRLWLQPNLVFSNPAQVRTKPSTAEPLSRPLRPKSLALRLGLARSFLGALVVAQITEHARVVIPHITPHGGGD